MAGTVFGSFRFHFWKKSRTKCVLQQILCFSMLLNADKTSTGKIRANSFLNTGLLGKYGIQPVLVLLYDIVDAILVSVQL